MPFTTSHDCGITLDAREMKRWSIPLSRVPVGSVVLNDADGVEHLPMADCRRHHVYGVGRAPSSQPCWSSEDGRRDSQANLRSSEERRYAAVSEERNLMARHTINTLAQGSQAVICATAGGGARACALVRQPIWSRISRARVNWPGRVSGRHGGLSGRFGRRRSRPATPLCGPARHVLKHTANTKLRATFTTSGEPR